MATKRIKVNHVFFRNIEGCGCSYSGNPKYSADMVLPSGDVIEGKTATDSGSAYGIRNYASYRERIHKVFEGEMWFREVETVRHYAYCEYHRTASGNVIFDYITDEKAEKE